MWSSAKDKNELNEKTKQIHILNEIIQMNSKQALSQKSTIEKLKKVDFSIKFNKFQYSFNRTSRKRSS